MFIDLNEQRQAVVLDSLQSLGTTPNLTDEQIDNISRFVIQMYCSKRQDARFVDVKDIGCLRWEFYSKYQAEGNELPPTPAALKQHLIRSNCITLMWKRTSTSFEPDIPKIGVDHGWNCENGKLSAIMTTELPAP